MENIMKKSINYRSVAAVLTSVAAVTLVILACMSVGNSIDESCVEAAQVAQTENASSGQALSASDKYYVLKEYNGDICVFTSDSNTEPYIVTNIDVSMLRQNDADALKKGISVDSFEKLLMLLEDFSS
jgi:hypothetical protein